LVGVYWHDSGFEWLAASISPLSFAPDTMFSGLELTLFLLGAAVLGVVAFRMMHLPPMLGYLVVGIVIGPHGLGFAEIMQPPTRWPSSAWCS